MLSSVRRLSLRKTHFRAFAGLTTGIGLTLGAVVASGYGPALPASAAPGSKSVGAIKDPVKIWSEDFETAGPAATALRSYTSASGSTYTADPYWLNQSLCNGAILSYNSGSTPDCPDDARGGGGSRQNLQRLADTLGQYRLGVPGSINPAAPANGSTAGTNPATSSQANRVVGEATISSPRPFGQIEFRTANPISLPESNRFLALSVDVADVSCAVPSHSKLDISFIDQAGTEVPTGSAPYSVCDDPGRKFFASPVPQGVSGWTFGGNSVAVGTMKRTKPVLIRGNNAGVQMRNQAPSSFGDDHAFDNLSIYDLTPTLSQTFTSVPVPAGGSTELRITVTNTSDLEAKPGWSFTNALPSGLTLAGAVPIASTCANGTGSPSDGGKSFTVSGDLLQSQSDCTITVNVTSAVSDTPSRKTFTNCPANFATLVGLKAPECATVEVLGKPAAPAQVLDIPAASPQVTVTKSIVPASGSPVKVGQDLAYSVAFRNNGTNVAHIDRVEDLRGVLDDATLAGPLTASNPTWTVGPLKEGIAPIRGALAPGQTVTIHYSAKIKPDGKRGDNVALSRLLPAGVPQDSTPSKSCRQAEACLENPVSSWSVSLTTDKPAAAPGETVSYTAKQTNTGAVAIQDPPRISIDLNGTLQDAHYNGDAPAAVDYTIPRLSWSTKLAAGEQRTITFTVTVKPTAGTNHRLRSVVDGGSNCPAGSPAPECSADTIVSAYPATGPSAAPVPPADQHDLAAITTATTRTPNWPLFVGGVGALTAGVASASAQFRGRSRAERNPRVKRNRL
ncbi:hypothetical protein GCM10023063_21110 [Arthrobacter methylotrophus]|uniref:DUF11 domain-containing protein n=1 Tax=Arthrobacter methylotrophus TaxID=121291 RepID=A0ABV5UVZ5_9MICC